jgi:phosphoserine phosphatase RsbU/P
VVPEQGYPEKKVSQITVRIGWPEWAFAACLVGWFLASNANPTSGATGVLSIAASVLFVVVTVRLFRPFLRTALWRVRNRLLAAYFFIGFVPLVLSLTLVGLGAYLVAGQLSIFLITSELDRQTAYLQGPLEFLARDEARPQALSQPLQGHLQERYPELEVHTVDAPKNWPDGHGLVVRKGRLHGWAQVSREGGRVFGMFPITEEYLGKLAPYLGETRMLSLDQDHPEQGNVARKRGFSSASSENRLPPAVNSMDVVIFSVSSVPAQQWEDPNQTEQEYLSILTRPSALWRTMVGRRASFASDWVQVTFYGVAILFLIALAIALWVGLSITSKVTGAVQGLYEGTQRVRAGDFTHRIERTSPDQLGALATSFNEMTSDLQRLVEVEKERERLHGELEIAREVQNQLYPRSVPDSRVLRITASCHPARMVSGDFYDYSRIEGGRIAISMGDVAGKGISAALLMSTLQSSFRTQLRSCGERPKPSELVTQLNRHIHAFTSPEKFATFFFGLFDENEGVLMYTNAGHLPPMLIRRGEVKRLTVNGMVLGAFSFAKFEEDRLEMEPGDLIFFFTDGITEPENDYGEMFGEERLADLLRRSAHLPEAEILDKVIAAAKQWGGKEELQDDMTALVLRRI